jgi:heme-degrading monooxygenase HmoA
MYLAMSKLKVPCGKEAEFEAAWKKHQQNIDGIKGFKEFNLIKGSINKEFTLYIFHSE